jgi:hypothetical protein
VPIAALLTLLVLVTLFEVLEVDVVTETGLLLVTLPPQLKPVHEFDCETATQLVPPHPDVLTDPVVLLSV